MTNEAFARIKIDQLLKDTDWCLTDGVSVRYEYPLDDGGRPTTRCSIARDAHSPCSKPRPSSPSTAR